MFGRQRVGQRGQRPGCFGPGQDQQQFVWPPSFVLARAYLDQLERSSGLAAPTIASTRTALSDAERRKWIDGLPNLAQEWVKNNEGRGVQARPLLTQYMAAMKARGAKPERDWER